MGLPLSAVVPLLLGEEVAFFVSSTSGNPRTLLKIDFRDTDRESDSYGLVGSLPSGVSTIEGMTKFRGALWGVNLRSSTGSPQNELWKFNHLDPDDESGDFGLVRLLSSSIARPLGLAAFDDALWVISRRNSPNRNDLWRINDPESQSGTVVFAGNLTMGTNTIFTSLTELDGALWTNHGRTIRKIDPQNPGSTSDGFGNQSGLIPSEIQGPPSAMVGFAGALWMINTAGSVLGKIDPTNISNVAGDFGKVGDLFSSNAGQIRSLAAL